MKERRAPSAGMNRFRLRCSLGGPAQRMRAQAGSGSKGLSQSRWDAPGGHGDYTSRAGAGRPLVVASDLRCNAYMRTALLFSFLLLAWTGVYGQTPPAAPKPQTQTPAAPAPARR